MANYAEEGLTVTYNERCVAVKKVKIKNFQNKMKTWTPGRYMSEKFFVDGLTLSLRIYPNGNEAKNEGNVSLFLYNDSPDEIQVEFDCTMNDVVFCAKRDKMKPASNLGFRTLYCHKGVKEVGTDEKTMIKVTFKSVKKELSNLALLSSIENQIKRGNDQLKTNIQSGTIELKRKYESIEENFEKRISKLESRLESRLEASSESIKLKIEDNSSKNNNVAKPRCPICLDEMSPNTKIAQCLSGHLLCWSCKEKMGDKECAFCEQPVNGRAFGMEAYLRTLFG